MRATRRCDMSLLVPELASETTGLGHDAHHLLVWTAWSGRCGSGTDAPVQTTAGAYARRPLRGSWRLNQSVRASS